MLIKFYLDFDDFVLFFNVNKDHKTMFAVFNLYDMLRVFVKRWCDNLAI